MGNNFGGHRQRLNTRHHFANGKINLSLFLLGPPSIPLVAFLNFLCAR